MRIEVHIRRGSSPRTLRELHTQLPFIRQAFIDDAWRSTIQNTEAHTPRRTGVLVSGIHHAVPTVERRRDITIIKALINVRYAVYVEFGTRKMTPRAMVFHGMLHTLPQLPGYLHRALMAG